MPRSGLNIISGKVQKPGVSDNVASRRGRRKPIDGSGASILPEGQIPTSQPQKYRCYVPRCSVAQKQKRNLSTHFKTKHVGIPWRIKLVEDLPQSKPAAQSVNTELPRPSSARPNQLAGAAPAMRPPSWTKIFSGPVPGAAGNGSIDTSANETRKVAHHSHLVVQDPYIQRHISSVSPSRHRLDAGPEAPLKANNTNRAPEDTSDEKIGVSLEHDRTGDLNHDHDHAAHQRQVNDARSTTAKLQAHTRRAFRAATPGLSGRILNPFSNLRFQCPPSSSSSSSSPFPASPNHTTAFPPNTSPFSPRSNKPTPPAADAALPSPFSNATFLQRHITVSDDENKKLHAIHQALEDGLRELKAQSARMERRVEGLLTLFSVVDEDVTGSDLGGSAT